MHWLDIPGNNDALKALVKRLRSGRATAFVGAGASAPMYPLWRQLIDRLADKACQKLPPEEAARKKAFWREQAKQQPAFTVSQIRALLKDGPYSDFLYETFKPRSVRSYTKTHELLVGLPFRFLVTLNYDLGLTLARLVPLPPFHWRSPNVTRYLTDELDGPLPVFHAHGLVSEIDTVVLDQKSYTTAYSHDPFVDLMGRLWVQEKLVIVGFGFGDPPLGEAVGRALDRSDVKSSAGFLHLGLIGLRRKELKNFDLKRDKVEELYHARALFYPIRETEDGGEDHSALYDVLAAAKAKLDGDGVGAPEPPPPGAEDEPPSPLAVGSAGQGKLDDDGVGAPQPPPPGGAGEPAPPRAVGWAAPDDPEGLYRRAVQRKHRKLYTVFDALPPALQLLEEAYVEVEVRGGEGIEPQGSDGRGVPLEELLRLDRAQHRWVTGRWLLVGEPGSGKTTQLRRLAARLAAGGPGSPLPVFRPLRQALEARRFLLDVIADELEADGVPGLRQILQEAGDEGRLVLLLDGLDEVPRERHHRVEEMTAALVDRFPHCTMVITTRPHGRSELGGDHVELKLLPLSDESRRAFLHKWFQHRGVEDPSAQTDRALDHFALDRPLDELSRVPLYLTLLAGLWDPEEPPPRRTSELFRAIFDYLYEGRHQRAEERRRIDARADVHRVLAYLAYGMTEDELAEETREGLESRLTRTEAKEVREPLDGTWPEGLWAFLLDVWERTQILGPHGDPEAAARIDLDPRAHRDPDAEPWSFLHRTFREYLVAEELGELHRRKGTRALIEMVTGVPEDPAGEGSEPEHRGVLSSLLRRVLGSRTTERPPAPETVVADVRGDPGRWAEPLALLAGRLGPGPGDELVQALARANPSVGRRALAAAQGLSPDTLRTVLALSDDWKERRKIFEEIPDQLGDPDAALALLDQLRRQTRDGNDLYFLDRAAKTVGERWSESSEAAERLRSRLYDHIPVTDEVRELFTTFRTASGDETPLWCKIPKGRGWIGSKEGEGHDDERPRHQVEVESPFRLAAVPVTREQYGAFDSKKAFLEVKGVPEEDLAHHPAADVTWYEAVAYCRWLAAGLGLAGAQLPSEEEWEYACRARTTTRYFSGDDEKDLADVGWYHGNSGNRTHRVAEKRANEFGLHDVHGNVWEWTASQWDANKYKGRPAGQPFPVDPRKPADLAASPGARRVLRGGSFWVGADFARSAYRDDGYPVVGYVSLGFRVLLPLPPDR